MTVISDPEPGYYTDIMVWRDCQLRQELQDIMNERVANGLPRLKLYADKIYNSGALILAAWNNRHGPVTPWMLMENSIMASIRIAVEWSFGTIVEKAKFVSFVKCQRLQEVPVAKYYHIAVLLANCSCCMYGSRHLRCFGVEAPDIQSYLSMVNVDDQGEGQEAE
jgi:hypothetical protein